MRKKYFLYLLILLFVSCEKEVDIDITSQQTSLLVVNSLYNADSIFKVHISHSTISTDNSSLWIDSAAVVVLNEGKAVDTLKHKETGLYESDSIPVRGKSYSLQVSCVNYDTLYANDQCPSEVRIVSTKLDKNIGNDEGDNYSRVTITFADDENALNYYETRLNVESSLFTNEDPVLLAEGDMDYYPWRLVFSDELINGKTYSLTYNFYSDYFNEDTLVVYLRSVSENYYEYKKKLLKHLYNQDGDFWDATSPVIMSNFVTNGYGIFAGYSEATDSIPFN